MAFIAFIEIGMVDFHAAFENYLLKYQILKNLRSVSRLVLYET